MAALKLCSRHSQMLFECVLLLQLIVLALGTVPQNSESQGTPEEPTSISGSDVGLPPHNEDASAVDNSELDFVKRLYDFGLGKRAYSYVSEYKRLPVYNFGLGKRSKIYGFGLGKRAGADGRLYSFGLGKRDYDDYIQGEEDAINDEEDLEDTDVDLMDKRERLYSFGLGKRAKPYSFGLGKRSPPSGIQRLYGFGLGKRGGSLYSFGLGKRGEGRMYSFGLGKRPVGYGRQSGSRFNFGLGKRSEDSDWDEYEEDIAEEDKRSSQGHRFGFGLGKREVTQGELEAVRNEERQETKHINEGSKNGTAEGSLHSGERAKRSLHYAFGLGKRAYDSESSALDNDEENEAGVEDFSRIVRRPFNFGLGKRLPMYDFGIGKRSEH